MQLIQQIKLLCFYLQKFFIESSIERHFDTNEELMIDEFMKRTSFDSPKCRSISSFGSAGMLRSIQSEHGVHTIVYSMVIFLNFTTHITYRGEHKKTIA